MPTNGSAGAYQTAFALNGLDFDVGVDERFDAPHKYLYFHQKLLLVTPGGGPVGGGTVVRVEGEGFDGFDNLAATAKCRFVRDGAACAATSSAMCDDGAAALGKVRVILSGNALECEAPDVGVVSDTHIQVSLNGVHFVGADAEDASWLLYQYYHQPRLLGLDPAGGPTAGSGAAGCRRPLGCDAPRPRLHAPLKPAGGALRVWAARRVKRRAPPLSSTRRRL